MSGQPRITSLLINSECYDSNPMGVISHHTHTAREDILIDMYLRGQKSREHFRILPIATASAHVLWYERKT